MVVLLVDVVNEDGRTVTGIVSNRTFVHLTLAHVFEVAKTEIYDFNVTFGIYKNVLGFEISVDDSVEVHKLDGEEEFCGVEGGSFESECFGLADVEEHVTTVDVFHYKVESSFLVDVPIHLHDERRPLQCLHDLQLLLQVSYVLLLLNLGLVLVLILEYLDCIYLRISGVNRALHKYHRSICTLADRRQEFKLSVDVLLLFELQKRLAQSSTRLVTMSHQVLRRGNAGLGREHFIDLALDIVVVYRFLLFLFLLVHLLNLLPKFFVTLFLGIQIHFHVVISIL